jgi:hypothetical protein
MDPKSLRELVSDTSEIEQMLVESNGEITPAIEAMLAVTCTALPEKIDNYSYMIDRMESIAAFYKAKSDMFLRLAFSAAKVSERCENNMKDAMKELKVTELLGNDIRFKLVKSNPAVNILDESLVPASYKITETTTRVDKKRLADDLKLGVPVAGAELTQGSSLRVFANSEARKK